MFSQQQQQPRGPHPPRHSFFGMPEKTNRRLPPTVYGGVEVGGRTPSGPFCHDAPPTLDSRHILRIAVLEDSAEGGLFAVRVRCGEPLLLQFWRRKPPFRNGQVEQTAARRRAAASEADFVLRALRRAPGLPNGHYWGPFVKNNEESTSHVKALAQY
ncbi:hypothetical protein EYF80_045416 [Liparis tanakae]|uniref:Uncharacterized protein n=1 Tax=Liparis tanakae TaxID=230148 RepID=A0A4Z2FT96_9TELE|nr:hypothetical protein EYF80_045416 [Liparis tanakae]